MKKIIRRNAILNIIKQMCAIIFPLISFPYVSRVLGAENYGKESFSYSVITYFMLIAAMGVSSYAVREGARVRNDKVKFQNLADQIFTINLLTTGISYVLLIMLVVLWEKLHSYWMILAIHSLGIVLTTVGADWVNTVYEDFLYITVRYITFQILAVAAMFVFVKSPNDYVIYAAIHMFANSGANLINVFYIRKYVHLKPTRYPDFRRHLKPLFVLFCNAISVQLYINSDVTMLGAFCGDEQVGIYSVAVKIYSIVKQLLNALITVIIPRISALIAEKNESDYSRLLDKTFHSVISLMLPVITGVFMMSREIVELVAGKEYEAGYLALRILSIALLGAVFSNFYCNAVLVPNRKEKYFLEATVVAAIVNVGMNLWLIPRYGFVGAAVTTVIAEFIVLGFGVYFSRNLCKFKINKRDLFSCVAGCIFVLFICIIVRHMVSGCIARIALSISSSVIVYFLILVILKNRFIKDALDRK